MQTGHEARFALRAATQSRAYRTGRRAAGAGVASPASRLLAAILGTFLFLLLALVTAGCSGSTPMPSEKTPPQNTSIRVLFAGSLIIPFDRLEKEFEAAHPTIDVDMEGHGSIQAIRLVSDLHEEADVVVTADYSLIPTLLYETSDPDSGLRYADWYVIFATNEMAVAYTEKSAFADEINEDNWFDIINRNDVRVGCSDPRFDANGYRALMTIKLAEDYYERPTLFFDTFGTKFRVPVKLSEEGTTTVIKVPEVLETKKNSSLVLRPNSVQLFPLLQSGDIDYAFEYTSVAKQHGVKYIPLPPEVDLSNPAFADEYDRVKVKLDFQRFASVKPEFPGEPIRYGATIPTNARDPQAAATFLAYLLGPEGQRIMLENYQPMITPAFADNFEAVPDPVKALCTPVD